MLPRRCAMFHMPLQSPLEDALRRLLLVKDETAEPQPLSYHRDMALRLWPNPNTPSHTWINHLIDVLGPDFIVPDQDKLIAKLYELNTPPSLFSEG